MKCPSEQWQVQQNQPLCLCFHGFQPRVGMHTNMFAFSKMQTVECSHNDKDRFSLKSPSVCFLHHVFLAGSESCNGNIRIIFGCHCLQYNWFQNFPLWFSSMGVSLQPEPSCPVPASAGLGIDSSRQIKIPRWGRGISVLCLASSSALHPLPQILSIIFTTCICCISFWLNKHWEFGFMVQPIYGSVQVLYSF